eukprot:358288-Chlamydomonas_euryale.AAC.11
MRCIHRAMRRARLRTSTFLVGREDNMWEGEGHVERREGQGARRGRVCVQTAADDCVDHAA